MELETYTTHICEYMLEYKTLVRTIFHNITLTYWDSRISFNFQQNIKKNEIEFSKKILDFQIQLSFE